MLNRDYWEKKILHIIYILILEELNKYDYVKNLMEKSYGVQVKTRPYLYYILQLIEFNHIIYSADYGTLLGIIRHQQEIYWDDDYDIFILGNFEQLYNMKHETIKQINDSELKNNLKLEEKILRHVYQCEVPTLNNKKIYLCFYRYAYFIQVFVFEINNSSNQKIKPYNYYYIMDIFPSSDNCRQIDTQKMFPLIKRKFANFEMCTINNAEEYLKKFYGDDCLTKYKICNHTIDAFFDWKNQEKYLIFSGDEFDKIFADEVKKFKNGTLLNQ
jgi:phosphorylcholine metabolism protein LicD